MAIKDLLVYVDNDAACASRVRAAAQLAKAHEAHLAGVYVKRRILIPAYAGVYIPAEVFQANEEMADELANKAKLCFQQACEAEGVNGEWFQEETDVMHAVTMHSRYVDMVVTAQRSTDDPLQNEFYRPDTLAMAAGRPVLVLPANGQADLPAKKIMVAWNGGRESVRALNDALPLLKMAKEVLVLTINPEGEEAIPGADISHHLARHGVSANCEHIPSAGISIGNAVLSRIADTGANLLVMGAYGHSRLRETVIGGVTREVLEHMTVPVLLSH